ncbi:MAG TPA: beta-propeller fold lactonase family protein [Gaiellaceae bacterium]|nr:beta-propeller fold lactonase family protein [Gaiellaceae bacterium]
MDRIYVQTNDAERNEVVAFDRAADGSLSALGRFETGGRGSGKPHLASQSSVVLSGDRLLVTNAGSGELSLFSVQPDGLRLEARIASGGSSPTSVAVAGDLAYVLNNGTPSIFGFSLVGGALEPIAGSDRPLAADADPAQVAFGPDGRILVVTERGTNSISTFTIDDDGLAEGPQTIPSAGATPYGFGFAGGSVIVTEAFGGEVGAAAASSYSLDGGRLSPVSASVADTRSEVCWAAVSKDGRFVYVTNFGDGTISSYAIGADGSLELLEAVAASTNLGAKGVRDEAITGDGRFLYALDADARRVYGWSVGADGSLAPVADADGLPETVAGLAAS